MPHLFYSFAYHPIELIKGECKVYDVSYLNIILCFSCFILSKKKGSFFMQTFNYMYRSIMSISDSIPNNSIKIFLKYFHPYFSKWKIFTIKKWRSVYKNTFCKSLILQSHSKKFRIFVLINFQKLTLKPIVKKGNEAYLN